MSRPRLAAGAWRSAVLRVRARLLLALGRPQSALAAFEALRHLHPTNPHVLASCAYLLAGEGRLDEATACLRTLLAAGPADSARAAAWFNLGYVLQRQSRHAEAEPAFEAALALNDVLDQAWYGLAVSRMQLGRFSDAIAALERHTALQALSPHGWYRLVEAKLAVGQLDEARKLLAHLRSFEPRVAAQLATAHRALA